MSISETLACERTDPHASHIWWRYEPDPSHSPATQHVPYRCDGLPAVRVITILSCRPAVPMTEDYRLGQLGRMPDGRFVAADDVIALPEQWVAQVDAGVYPWARIRRRMPGVTFGATLLLDSPAGPVLYQFTGYRGSASAIWLCERIWD